MTRNMGVVHKRVIVGLEKFSSFEIYRINNSKPNIQRGHSEMLNRFTRVASL